jgi:hypothetical protein
VSSARAKKLSYNEQREYESIEERVVAAEEALAEARRRAEDPAIRSEVRLDKRLRSQDFPEVARRFGQGDGHSARQSGLLS